MSLRVSGRNDTITITSPRRTIIIMVWTLVLRLLIVFPPLLTPLVAAVEAAATTKEETATTLTLDIAPMDIPPNVENPSNDNLYVDVSALQQPTTTEEGEGSYYDGVDFSNSETLRVQLSEDMPIWIVHNTRNDDDDDDEDRNNSHLEYFVGETDDQTIYFRLLRYHGSQERSVLTGVIDDYETGITYNLQMDWQENYIVRVLHPDDLHPDGEPIHPTIWDYFMPPSPTRAKNLFGGFAKNLAHQFGNLLTSKTTTSPNLPSAETSSAATTQGPLIIDVMVLWTTEAECANSGLSQGCTVTDTTQTIMEADTTTWVAIANTVLANSETGTQINLVHQQRDSSGYSEVDKGSGTILFDLKGTCDGSMDYIHELRDTHQADLVSLIVNTDLGPKAVCGRAYFASDNGCWSDPAFGFGINDWACTLAYTPIHEIGHNLGCQHDRGTRNACDCGTQTDFGYRSPTGNFRTVMSYSCKQDECDNNPGIFCPRIPYFSGEGTYNGESLGGSTNSCRDEINRNKFNVARFR